LPDALVRLRFIEVAPVFVEHAPQVELVSENSIDAKAALLAFGSSVAPSIVDDYDRVHAVEKRRRDAVARRRVVCIVAASATRIAGTGAATVYAARR
jgi:hypothetical protein